MPLSGENRLPPLSATPVTCLWSKAMANSVTPKQPKSKPAPAGGLSFTDAAERVLGEFGHKSPMHYRAITETAIKQGWLATAGITPPASMYSQLITEIRRDKNHGRFPRFVRHGKGISG